MSSRGRVVVPVAERGDRRVVARLADREPDGELSGRARGRDLAPDEWDERVAEMHRRPRQVEVLRDFEAGLLADRRQPAPQRVVVEVGERGRQPAEVRFRFGDLLRGRLAIVVVGLDVGLVGRSRVSSVSGSGVTGRDSYVPGGRKRIALAKLAMVVPT